MGKAAGFALILAGVGTAAYVIPSLDTRDRAAERRASEVAAITTASSPGRTAVSPAASGLVSSIEKVRPSDTAARAEQLKTEPSKIATGSTPERSDQRIALAKDIQRELYRVGCYAGDIDGEWTPKTRQAMKTFVDRVNATLPVDNPDHILKTLVSGHPGEACGKVCPTGQAMANGRCVPAAVQAQSSTGRSADTRRAPLTRAGRTETAAAPAEAQMEKAKPTNKPAEAVVSSWAPTVVPAATLPPVAAVPQPTRPAAPIIAALPTENAPAASRPDLSGRMSIGIGASVDSAQQPISADVPPAAAPAPRAATKIVIKKRDGAVASAPPSDSTRAAAAVPTENAVKNTPPQPRQKTAAIEVTEPIVPQASEPVTSVPAPRAATKRPPSRAPREGVYRAAPPARFVGVYVSPPMYNPPVYRERFGPAIFKRLERDAR